MTLEEIETLARDWRAADKREHVAYIADDLARIICVLLPVVRAAGSWSSSNVPVRTARVTKADFDLLDALDAMRATLGREK